MFALRNSTIAIAGICPFCNPLFLLSMQLASLFTTPMAMFEHPDLVSMNKEMTEILVAESESIPSISISNVGGWHSQYNLQTRPEACFRKLDELIVGHAREMSAVIAKNTGRTLPQVTATTEMWAMVMREGDYTIPHTHAETHWATVYYADAGDADETAYPNSGAITFTDPRFGFLPIPGLDIAASNFMVQAKAGQLLVFPGWLMHYVHPYRGKRPRVSLACNVFFKTVNA
jgi:uncharacterized protein (TIGR02466 family)